MTPAPNRSWFQWSLRTLFVVMTIFGWALACYPYWVKTQSEIELTEKEFDAAMSAGHVNGCDIVGGESTTVGSTDDSGSTEQFFSLTVECSGPNPRLIGPAIALAGFIAWTGFNAFCRSRSALACTR